jgi:ATP-dependent Clp protease ATP-binding subunit ClpA
MSQINRDLQLALESALREAVNRRHAFLTVEHLLYALLHDACGADVLRHCGVNIARLKRSLEQFLEDELDQEPGDGPVETGQTLAFHRVIQAALYHVASAERHEVEAGDVLAALFQEPDSHAVSLLRGQGVSRLDVLRYVSHGIPKMPTPDDEATPSPVEGEPCSGDAAEEIDPLAAFASNLNQRAAGGQLDPLIGRERELERTVQVLARRRKNNPIFVGESGVGKTAMAEGLALRIHAGEVPEELQDAEIFSIDLGAMLAGTRYRGDFEARFKALIRAVQSHDNPIVFIDEIHNVLGAGAAQGATVDASSMLKPLLQSGELRCMGSTTYAEYRAFERDRALARRFQCIEIHEPSSDEAAKIIKGLAPHYGEHHGVRYTASALRACVDLSAKHLHDRFLPDKAIDVMDEAGASVRLRRSKLRRKTVGRHDVEAVVARMAQIPLPTASTTDRQRLETIEENLRSGVFGQDDAIATLSHAIKRVRAGLGGHDRPVGSFLFMGPTGVGKTELAKQLARCLGVSFLRFDMSEYMEKHAVARLIGAPPGYVGYEEGGILVDRVRRNPYAVLLLDEIEKAHIDLFDILLQVMDHATLTDNHGREADFRHVTLIMTSNVGAREMATRAIGFTPTASSDGRKEVERLFNPEFRNRLDEIVRFAQLTPEVMLRVVDKFIRELASQLRPKKVTIELSDAARRWLADEGFDPGFGARPLARVIQTRLKDRLADEVLFGRLARGGQVQVDVGDEGLRLVIV